MEIKRKKTINFSLKILPFSFSVAWNNVQYAGRMRKKLHQRELREPAVLCEALQGDMTVMFRVSDVKTEIGYEFAGIFLFFEENMAFIITMTCP